MQINPISSQQPENTGGIDLRSLLRTAVTVKDHILEKFNKQEIAQEKKLIDPEYTLAQKYYWAIMAYNKIMQLFEMRAPPGPGNGYFETIQLLFDQIGKLGKNDPMEYHGFLKQIFPRSEVFTNASFPAIIYFLAKNIATGKHDFWYAVSQPMNETINAANQLLIASHHLFHSFWDEQDDDFQSAYESFLEAWILFCKQMDKESGSFCPDLELSHLLEMLNVNDEYVKKKETAKRITGYFLDSPRNVLKALSKYPDRHEDTYENNRAYIHARLFIDLASKNLKAEDGIRCHEVTILK